MEYSPDYLNQALPNRDPPAHLVPQEVERELAVRSELLRGNVDALLTRSARWTYAIFSELMRGAFRFNGDELNETRARGTSLSVGLFDPATEGKAFGVILQVARAVRSPFLIEHDIEFPRLGLGFPFAIRQSVLVEHAPPHPLSGTSAAWAQCPLTKTTGVLTAGHVVRGLSAGAQVALSNGVVGTLTGTAYPVIDAAFVGAAAPVLGARLPVLRFPTAGQAVIVDCQAGSSHRTVIAAGNSLGITQTALFRVLFLTDTPCNPGDSGALVRTPQGEAVGIYSGALSTPAAPGGMAGFNQNFEQALFALQVDAHL